MKARNYGIDALRILCMTMVPILHVTRHGGILNVLDPGTPTYLTVWLLEVAAFCAVDCFALISGYVGLNSSHSFGRLLQMICQGSFYCLLAVVFFWFYDPTKVQVEALLAIVLPFVNQYWYFTAFVLLYPFMPYVDKFVNSLTIEQLRRLTLTIVVVLSLVPTLLALPNGVFPADIAKFGRGHSVAWIALLYYMGAHMRREDELGTWRHGSRRYLVFYMGLVACLWMSRIAITWFNGASGSTVLNAYALVSYTSPLVLGCGAALLLCFRGLHVGPRAAAAIELLAPLCFGVYLLHENPLVREAFIDDRFAWCVNLGPAGCPLTIVATALCIWLVGSLVDYVRRRLFTVCRVNELCSRLGTFLDSR